MAECRNKAINSKAIWFSKIYDGFLLRINSGSDFGLSFFQIEQNIGEHADGLLGWIGIPAPQQALVIKNLYPSAK